MWTALLTIGALTTLFHYVDRGITTLGLQKPYYATHVLHNALMAAITAGDVVASFTNIQIATSLPYNYLATYLCYALHFYHIMDYWRSFHTDDWLHHVLMIGVALPLGATVPAGALMGFSLFFTTGLPGGICYAMIFAERNGWVTRQTRKAIDKPVQLWIRAPGCVAHAALTLATSWSAPAATPWDLIVGTITAALTGWNGLYFMEQVVSSVATPPLNRATGAREDESNMGPTGAIQGTAATLVL